MMPTADLPMPAGEPLEPANVSGTAERRVSEQLVTDWEQETRRLGHALALMTLDTSTMSGPKWAHRFIIDVHPTVENSTLVLYGARFASLFGLPEKPDQSVPITAQLPARYLPVFIQGCITSTLSGAAVRMQGSVEREDGGQELYRVAFIRLSLDPRRLQHFALGAFNCRVAERQIA
jgi:hypothetical protein